jgi:hypothetical protein
VFLPLESSKGLISQGNSLSGNGGAFQAPYLFSNNHALKKSLLFCCSLSLHFLGLFFLCFLSFCVPLFSLFLLLSPF